jgi:predicted nucleic acid-binding protein
MNAVDTNVLIYVQNPRDADKRQKASELIDSLPDGVLLWQVTCEYLAASRKLAPLGYSLDQAFDDIGELSQLWSVALPSPRMIGITRDWLSRFSLSFWDAMLVAACCDAGIPRRYTEDFGGYSAIDGVHIVNPFV